MTHLHEGGAREVSPRDSPSLYEHHRVMSTVFMHAVVSVDGFIADADDDVGPLFEWYFNGDAEIVDGGPFKVSTDSVRYVRPMWQGIGKIGRASCRERV